MLVSKQLLTFLKRAVPLGFYNEADTYETSSILIYSQLQTGLYTQCCWQDSALLNTSQTMMSVTIDSLSLAMLNVIMLSVIGLNLAVPLQCLNIFH